MPLTMRPFPPFPSSMTRPLTCCSERLAAFRSGSRVLSKSLRSRKLYDLVKFGPTSANTSPARFVFVTSDEAKARLVPLMPEMNREKTRTAPVVVLIAYDLQFFEKLDKLMPHRDYKPWFTGNPAYAQKTAMQSGTLQGAYLMLAARSLGLDCGPMLGDDDKINAEFFPDSSWRLNFVCALGYGVKEKLFPRLPRLDFDEAAQIL